MSNNSFKTSWNIIIIMLLFLSAYFYQAAYIIPIIILIFLGISKKIKFNVGARFGRKSVITTLMLNVAIILFALWDKKIAAGQVMPFVISLTPLSFLPLIIKDLFDNSTYKENGFPILKKDTPFSKKPEPRPNLSDKRWYRKAFSYPLLANSYNGIYPRLIYALVVWLSFAFITPVTESFSYLNAFISMIFLISLLFDMRVKRKVIEKVYYAICFFISAAFVIVILTFCQHILSDMNYSWMSRNNMSGWFNNSYSKTQIGKDGSFDNGQDLLLRVIWNNKNGENLLPATYFDLYTDEDSNWTVAPDFVAGKELKEDAGAVRLPQTSDVPLTNLSFITKNGNLKKYNYSNPTVPMKSNYDNKDIAKTNYIVILGQILQNPRGASALPIPTNSSYIVGDQGDSRFSKYASGTVMFAHNNNMVNWQVSFHVKKYLDLHQPINFDLTYPEKYDSIFKNIVNQAGIKDIDSADLKVSKVQAYFLKNYKYTLDLMYHGKPRTLEDFLTVDKRGHCEYFATSMTLILRYLGIPTKYSTGFLVTEHHPEESSDMYWIRKKDSHAWATYWNGEGWKFVDATPYSNSAWSKDWDQAIYDKFVHIQYVIDNINVDTIKEDITSNYSIVSIGIFIIVIFSIIVIKRLRTKEKTGIKYTKDKIEKRFVKVFKNELKENPKIEGEPWLTWARRINNQKVIEIVISYYKQVY